jgi:hypothetical protein
MITLTIGLLLFAQISAHGSYFSDLFPGFIIVGIGLGFSFVPISPLLPRLCLRLQGGLLLGRAGMSPCLVHLARQPRLLSTGPGSAVAASRAPKEAHQVPSSP